jgi:tRNA dimethylallyltransferase
MTSSERVRAALAAIPVGLPLIAVVGPTASGKSDVAIALCKALGGEAVSADSRQVYRGLDIGSGKVEGALDPSRGRRVEVLGDEFEVAPYISEDVPHWLLDIAPPNRVVTAAQYQLLAYDVLADLGRRARVPVVVGGTGLYVHAVVDGLVMPEVPPDPALRERLETMSADALRDMLLGIDPEAGAVVDLANPRRMVRAIEVARSAGSVGGARGRVEVPFRTLMLGIGIDRPTLLERIHRRLHARVEGGLIEEVEGLRNEGLSDARLEDLGLEYRWVGRYLRGVSARAEMLEELERAIARFARRQMTWFRKRGPVLWIETVEEAVARAREFVDATKSLHSGKN